MNSTTSLRKAYLACRPISEITKLLNNFPKTSFPSEDDIVKTVFQNEIATKYPPSREYRLAFTKLLITFFETHAEIGDHLYDELAKIVADSTEKPSFCSYEIGDEEFECVTLIENRAFVTQGSTGFRSWPAAKILAEVLLCENLEGRRLVELGAGVGLTGLVVLKKRPEIASYTFTDCHAGVLDTLRQNVELNSTKPKVEIQVLDWLVGGSIQADIVVGADIVFDKDIVPALVKLIVDAVRTNSRCQAIISSVIRNEDTYQIFYDSVSQQLECEKLHVASLRYFENIDDRFEVLRLSEKK